MCRQTVDSGEWLRQQATVKPAARHPLLRVFVYFPYFTRYFTKL
jgi:hypothetical protein